jgi:hypothetical protein
MDSLDALKLTVEGPWRIVPYHGSKQHDRPTSYCIHHEDRECRDPHPDDPMGEIYSPDDDQGMEATATLMAHGWWAAWALKQILDHIGACQSRGVAISDHVIADWARKGLRNGSK